MSELHQEEESPESVRPAFASRLKEGKQRFLAHVVENALDVGRRSATDFIRHFPPSTIMEGLQNQPRLRAAILVLTTGVKERIAIKKSAASAAEDLKIALDEGETDADSVMMLFQPDDRIRYLDPTQIWRFLVEGEFWAANPSKKEEFEVAKQHVAFMLDRALEDKLITHRDVIDGITVEEIVTRLPKSELGRIISRALDNGHRDAPFRDDDMLEATPSATLVRYVPLPHIWKSVVEPRIARAHGYAAAPPTDSIDPRAWGEPEEQPAEEPVSDESAPTAMAAAEFAGEA